MTTTGANRPDTVIDGLNAMLADSFALYIKTENFHWHLSAISATNHLLFDDQASQIFAMTDVIAEGVRKLGGQTLKSIGHIARLQRITDNEAEGAAARNMLAELLRDNRSLGEEMHALHALCDQIGDVATASLLENWIDEADGRAWFLFETGQSQ
jgi:starvation-inducible DNA-binding protein